MNLILVIAALWHFNNARSQNITKKIRSGKSSKIQKPIASKQTLVIDLSSSTTNKKLGATDTVLVGLMKY